MNVSALLQESPSGDLRKRQQQQQQQAHQQQNQQQPSQHQQQQQQQSQQQQPQQIHYTPLQLSRERERERDRDQHRHQISHQQSQHPTPSPQHQISPPYPAGKPSKSQQISSHPPSGPGFPAEYPTHGRPGVNSHHPQLSLPSPLAKDLNMDKHSNRMPRPIESSSNYQRDPPFHPLHASPSTNASPPSANVSGPPFAAENRHHPPNMRPPTNQRSPSSSMHQSLDFPHERGGVKSSSKSNAPPHAGGGSLPLYPTPVATRPNVNHGPGFHSRPRSPPSNGPLSYCEPSQMYNNHSHHLPPLSQSQPPPSQSGPSSHARSRTNAVGHSSHSSKNRSSPAMGSLQRSIEDHPMGHGSSMGPPITQSGNAPSVTTGPHPTSSSSPRTQGQMMAGPAAAGLHNSSAFFVGPGTQREREREFDRWERERDHQREREWERGRGIVTERHGDRIERHSRSGPGIGPGGPGHMEMELGGFPGGGMSRHNNPKRTAHDDERDWEREREITADQQRKKEHETNMYLSKLRSPPMHRSAVDSGPIDLGPQRHQQQSGHPSQIQSHPGNAQQPSHHNHASHHHHHHLHHHHNRAAPLKGKGKDMGVMKGLNPGTVAVVIEESGTTAQQQQQQGHHQPGSPYGESPFRPSPPTKGAVNGTIGPGQNNSNSSGPQIVVPQHTSPRIHAHPHSHQPLHPHNHPPRSSAHGLLHHSQSLPAPSTTAMMHRSPSPQVSHPIRLFPPPLPEPLVPGVHLGIYVYPRLPFPFTDFPEKVRVKIGQDASAGAVKKSKMDPGVVDDVGKDVVEVDGVVVECEVDREVRASIIVPWGFLLDCLPTMANKEGGWKGLNIWGGGIIGGTPANLGQIGPSATIGGRRVYTDDSEPVLCVLHAGFASVGMMRKAKEQRNDMKVEVRLSREGRFVGGFGAAYISGEETEKDKSVKKEGAQLVEEDGRLILSAGWGNGHDGAGMEILKVEFVKGSVRSIGKQNRKQRLLEYTERRNTLCPPPTLPSRRRRSQQKRFTDLRVWKDDGCDVEIIDSRVVVLSVNKTEFSPGFKYNPEALKNVLFPDYERRDSRPRKRRKLAGVVENKDKGGRDDTNEGSVASGNNQNPNHESDSIGIVVETLRESFLISQYDPDGDETADKENRRCPTKCRGRQYTISLILGEKDKDKDMANLLKDIIPEEPRETGPTEASIVIGDPRPSALPGAELLTSPADSLATMAVDPPPPTTLNDPHKNAADNTTAGDSDAPSSAVDEGQNHQREDKEIARPLPMEPISKVPLSPTEHRESKLENPLREVVVIPAQPPPVQVPPEVLSPPPMTRTLASAAVEPLAKKSEFMLDVLQRDIGEDNFQFGEDGVGILSDEVDSRDSTQKGWLIQVVRWRKA